MRPVIQELIIRLQHHEEWKVSGCRIIHKVSGCTLWTLGWDCVGIPDSAPFPHIEFSLLDKWRLWPHIKNLVDQRAIDILQGKE